MKTSPHPTAQDVHGFPSIETIHGILFPMESHILARWSEFKEVFDLPVGLAHQLGVTIAFTPRGVLVAWIDWDEENEHRLNIPWPAFLAFYRQHS